MILFPLFYVVSVVCTARVVGVCRESPTGDYVTNSLWVVKLQEKFGIGTRVRTRRRGRRENEWKSRG